MQKSSRVAEISTKVVGGGYVFMFIMYNVSTETTISTVNLMLVVGSLILYVNTRC